MNKSIPFFIFTLCTLVSCYKKNTHSQFHERIQKHEEAREAKKIEATIVEQERQKNSINSDGDLLTDVQETQAGSNPWVADLPRFKMSMEKPAQGTVEFKAYGQLHRSGLLSQENFIPDLALKTKLMVLAWKALNGEEVGQLKFQEQSWGMRWNEAQRFAVSEAFRKVEKIQPQVELGLARIAFPLVLRGDGPLKFDSIDKIQLKARLSKEGQNEEGHFFLTNVAWELGELKLEKEKDFFLGPYLLQLPGIPTDLLLKHWHGQGDLDWSVEDFSFKFDGNPMSYRQLIAQITGKCYQLTILTEKGLHTWAVSTELTALEFLKQLDPGLIISADGQIHSLVKHDGQMLLPADIDLLSSDDDALKPGRWIVLGSSSLKQKMATGEMLALVHLGPVLLNKWGRQHRILAKEKAIQVGEKLPLGKIQNRDIWSWQIEGKEKGGEFTWIERNVRDWELCEKKVGRDIYSLQPCNFGTCKVRYLNYTPFDREIDLRKNLKDMRLNISSENQKIALADLIDKSEIQEEGGKYFFRSRVDFLSAPQNLVLEVAPDTDTAEETIGFRGHNCRPDHDPFDTKTYQQNRQIVHTYTLSVDMEKASF